MPQFVIHTYTEAVRYKKCEEMAGIVIRVEREADLLKGLQTLRLAYRHSAVLHLAVLVCRFLDAVLEAQFGRIHVVSASFSTPRSVLLRVVSSLPFLSGADTTPLQH